MSIAKGVQYLKNESQSLIHSLMGTNLAQTPLEIAGNLTKLLKEHDEAASFIDFISI